LIFNMAEKEKKSIEEKKTIEEKKEEEIKPEEIISLSEAPIEELKQFKEMDEFDIVRIRQLYVEHLFDQPTKNEMGFLTNTQKTDLTDGEATTLHKHDHGDLDGLGDDDHPQYKTDTKNYEAGENLTIRKLSSRGHQTTINGETILRDSYVSEITGQGDTNFGSQTYMRVEQDSISHFTQGIIWFDISSLPNADDVVSVKLKFYVSKVINLGGSNYMVIGTKRVTATWVENTITWNNKPGEGGTYGSSANINATGWYEVDITNLYKEWKNETYTNYGVWLYGSEYSVTHLPAYSDINSKEAASNKPYLYITYWGDKTKVYKATAANSMGTHLAGFNTESKNVGESILIQSSGSLDGFSLTEGSSYYVSNTPGEISTAPGTVTKKVGVALSPSVLIIDLIT